MKLEVIVVPVADVDRAKEFYGRLGLGWRLDMDVAVSRDYRVIQFTPTGSSCSIIFGTGITSGAPGSAQGLHLIVSDLVATRADLIARGVDVSELFYDSSGVFHHLGAQCHVDGPHPQRHSYGSYASFKDPDGNAWFFQEVTTRLPGHVDISDKVFSSPIELTRALLRAQTAYREHEPDSDREADALAWYAEYIVREQMGTP